VNIDLSEPDATAHTGRVEHREAPRIVMLDDNPHLFPLLKMLIRRHYATAKVETFEHGNPALHFMRDNPPDLLITDWNHPGATVAQLAALGEFPILILTGFRNCITTDLPHKRVAVLHKPYRIDEFIMALRNLLQ